MHSGRFQTFLNRIFRYGTKIDLICAPVLKDGISDKLAEVP